VDVDLECQLPFLVTYVSNVTKACLMSGVVDENIDPAECLHTLGRHVRRIFFP
jgi:hypothetical protein